MRISAFSLDYIRDISSIRLHVRADMTQEASLNEVGENLDEVLRRSADQGVPRIDPVNDMKIKDAEFKRIVKKITHFEGQMKQHVCHAPDDERFRLYKYKHEQIQKLARLRIDLLRLENNEEIEGKLCGMQRVLRRLGMVTKGNVVTKKGLVACEVSSGDELVAAELLLNGNFTTLASEQIVSLVSCFVYEAREEGQTRLQDLLGEPYRLLRETARQVAQASKEAKLDVDELKYVAKFNAGLMDVCYSWAKRAKFADIAKMTPQYEGNIVRVIRRLDELLGEFECACRVIGNMEMRKKFRQCRLLIRRDIIFCGSLYLDDETPLSDGESSSE